MAEDARIRPETVPAAFDAAPPGSAPTVDDERARRALFLAEASRVLASSLDSEATLVSLARLSVPAIADWCAVDVLADDGTIRPLAVAHADPDTERIGRELLARYPPNPDARSGVPRVLRTGEPELREQIPDMILDRVVRRAEDRAVVRTLGLRSIMIVPMRARGRVLGAISWLTAESGRRYGVEDLAFVEDLAYRAALAADNARLYGEAEGRRRTAEELARVARSLTESLDLEGVGDRIVESVLPIFGAQSAVLRLREPDGSLRRLALAGTWAEDLESSAVIPSGASVVGRAAADGTPAWSSDLMRDPNIVLTDELRHAVGQAGARAALAVPIRLRGEILGALSIAYDVVRGFSAGDVSVLQAFADQAAVAIRNVQLFAAARSAGAEAQEAERRAKFLAEASRVLAASLDMEETLRRLAHLGVPALADWCAIHVVEPDGRLRRLHTAYADPQNAQLAEQFERLYGLMDADDAETRMARVMREGQAELVPEISDEWLASTVPDAERARLARELGARSLMMVPLVARGRTLGVLTFVSTQDDRRYGPVDLTLAWDLGSRAALAVANARLFRQSEARRKAAEALAAVGRALNETLEPNSVAQRIVESVRALLGVQSAVVYRLADSGETVALAVAGDAGPAFRGRFSLPAGIGTVGPAIRERRPIVTPNLLTDDRIVLSPEVRAKLADSPHRAVLAVPLLVKGHVIGALMAGDRLGRVYDDDDVQLAEAFADQAAVALENAQLYLTAQEANHAKDEFLATMSHELRTPLQAILGWLMMLRSGRLDAATAAQALETIERNARAQARLVDDLLDVSRIVAGKMQLDVRAVDLARVIDAALEAVRPAADAKGIRLDIGLEPGTGPVWGDPSRLQQVVWNLLSNAVKFTPRGGRVEVRLVGSDAGATIIVRDTGRGIRPDLIAHLFEPFWQGEASSTRRHGGLGLGLAIARQLVEIQGGTIEAASDGEDKGATFTVGLPVMDVLPGAVARVPARATERRDAMSHGLPSLAGVRVLVVEDDEDSRDVLVAALDLSGADAIGVASAEAALAALDGTPADVLVADIAMPGTDGYELIRRVRALGDRRARTPSIAVTAYARRDDRERAFEAGFDAYVAKPISPADVCALVLKLAADRTDQINEPPLRS